jgi:hypothetical protein
MLTDKKLWSDERRGENDHRRTGPALEIRGGEGAGCPRGINICRTGVWVKKAVNYFSKERVYAVTYNNL